MEQITVTLSLDEEKIAALKSFYEESARQVDNPYVLFSAQGEGVTITVYAKVKDGKRKVVFQGPNAGYESQIWGTPEVIAVHPHTAAKSSQPSSRFPQIGSDEVGTGDFFGPVIVVASYVRSSDLPLLEELGVTDSKLLSDEKILEIGPKLLRFIDYSQLCVPNEKFNEAHQSGLNMNAMKARLHNRCLLNVKSRHPEAQAYQDQFAEPPVYFSYLRQEKEVLRDIVFATKGETKFPSVACASVLARYSFLRHMEEMGKKYGCDFPLGAGEAVDAFASEFAKIHGKEELNKVAKANFANMKRI